MPGSYAFQAYDAAMLIDSALKQTGGKTDNKDALRAALKKADFKSLRGAFKFNTNNYPIQDFYLVKVAKRARRQIPDRDRAEGVRELLRSARQGLPDEVSSVARFPLSAYGEGGRPRSEAGWGSECSMNKPHPPLRYARAPPPRSRGEG